jgi:4a-hydroxytetrahydrobiopterin dehydratase
VCGLINLCHPPFGRPCVGRIIGEVETPTGWAEVNGALEREFRFRDFAEALAFVNRVGELAEAAHHHPDISIHWNQVTLRWWTHVKDAITDRDVEMAHRTNDLTAKELSDS